ncbi:MAG: electron transfer flavoprotein subunit alpha/FixB family protein [Rhodospirillaceae bacterium]|jgi:electron transfer flavoprotein alpha subunit|nr:electron transfer flavoprotein subunit alpha/FixB family protein [Rhodospirillaceae bacterium]
MIESSRLSERSVEIDERIATYKGVWVFIETDCGHTNPVSWELIGEGRKLADTLGVEVWGVILSAPGDVNYDVAKDAFSYGADGVYLIEDEILGDYRTVPYTKGLTYLVNKYKPEILLLGATILGRDLAGAVATTLTTGLTADCTGLRIDVESNSMAATRPTFGGSLLCTIHTLKARPQMATVRPRVMEMPIKKNNRTGQIVNVNLGMKEEDIITKVVDYIRGQDQIQLAFSDFIVSGGRGLGKIENFRLINELATVLGAEVGGSLPLVQAGWIDSERQIGQTGKTVRPKLYIAVGISGAIQHRVGIDGANCIVAINSDPNAPIFDFAHYGIVGDAIKIMPSLTEAFRNRINQIVV